MTENGIASRGKQRQSTLKNRDGCVWLDLNSIVKSSLQDKPDVTMELLPEEVHNKDFATFLNMHSIVYGKLSFCKSLNNSRTLNSVKELEYLLLVLTHISLHMPYSSLLREA